MTKMVELGLRVAKGLGDPDYISYSLEDDIYPALIEADTAILNFRPDANSSSEIIELVAGTFQAIPAASLRLIDIRCNIHADGSTELRDVHLKAKGEMIAGWRTMAKEDLIEHYMFDDRMPKEFEVSPPVNAGRKVRIVTSKEFDDYGTIGASTSSLLPQSYDPAKVEWALYRCYSRDNSPNSGRAKGHLSNFYQILGIKVQRDVQASPKSEQQES